MTNTTQTETKMSGTCPYCGGETDVWMMNPEPGTNFDLDCPYCNTTFRVWIW